MPFSVCKNCGRNVCHTAGGFFCECEQGDPVPECREVQRVELYKWGKEGFGDVRRIIRDVLKMAETLQTPTELEWLYWLLRKSDIQTVLEIGGWHGGTARLWSELFGSYVVTVDKEPKSPWIGGVVIQADSHEHSTPGRCIEANSGELYDMLFIDGDHSAQGVATDYRLYSPLVNRGGVVVFHDIFYPTFITTVGAFFAGLKGKKEKIEVYQGIGVLYV